MLKEIQHPTPIIPDNLTKQLHWAVETGLGPLVYRALNKNIKYHNIHANLYSNAQSALLINRLYSEKMLNITKNIIAKSLEVNCSILLLKGISISSQYYPDPSLRVMRDIDILVNDIHLDTLRDILYPLGFIQKTVGDRDFFLDHHHDIPYYNQEIDVWVEVHTGLIAKSSVFSKDHVFSKEMIIKETRDDKFFNLPVKRLSAEYQLIYTATHWALELKKLGGLIPVADVILIVQQGDLDWLKIVKIVGNTPSAAYIYLMMSFIVENQLVSIDSNIMHSLRHGQTILNRFNLYLLHKIILLCMVRGQQSFFVLNIDNLGYIWNTLLSKGLPHYNLSKVVLHFISPQSLRKGLFRILKSLT